MRSATQPHACLLCRRLVPHALLGLLVLFQPGAFASWAYYLLALGGMACERLLGREAALASADLQASL